MNLRELIDAFRDEGYTQANAEARVCQDIILKAIDESAFADHITVKGGVVMRSISGDARRATQDMDLDFIRYSLQDESIRAFITRLNCLHGITILIAGEIEELSQQEYHGKRVFITIADDTGYALRSKIDLGVHKQVQIEQDEYCFDVCLDDEGASLLINSKEQIFTEKLRSILRFGPLSTRFKDVFDMCYLSNHVNLQRLEQCINTYILSDPGMKENDMDAIRTRVQRTFSDRAYRQRLERSRSSNWMEISVSEALERITAFLNTL